MTEIEEELIMYDLSNTLTFTLIRHGRYYRLVKVWTICRQEYC